MSEHSSRAIRIERHGGPEELQLATVTVGEPGPVKSASATRRWA